MYVVNNALVKYVYRRHRGGIAFNALVRLLFGLTTRDTQSGLKGFSRSAAARMFQQLYTDGFLFDIEIFIRSRALGIPVTEVPVQLTFEDDVTTVQQFSLLLHRDSRADAHQDAGAAWRLRRPSIAAPVRQEDEAADGRESQLHRSFDGRDR